MAAQEKAFGQVLRKLRNTKGLSQEDLALAGDLDRTFISMLERGVKQPSLTTILKLSAVLDIEPDKLIKMVVQEIQVKVG